MAASTPNHDKILQLAKDLPPAAAVLGKLQHLLADPNATLDEICALLKRDIALSSRILRISNSTFFSPVTPNASIEEAVGYLGYAEIYKLVGVTLASQCWSHGLRFYGCSADQLWLNAVSSALAMESLAQFVGLNPRSTYTAGLVRSLGKLILDAYGVQGASAAAPFDPASDQPLGTWETASFGISNPAVAALVLRNWNFAPDTCDAVEHQYTPESAAEGNLTPWLLNLAGRITVELGYGLPGEVAYWELRPETLSHTKLVAGDLELCSAETKMAVDTVRRAFGSV
jgi:HD-like signal output (HDOD) protein